MEKSNTLDYLRFLNEVSKDEYRINNKNIIDLLIDCIEFNKTNNIEKDKYLYIYNYINIFREYYNIMKETIKNNYSKITKNLNNNNEPLIENEIELIKYYRAKIFDKELELLLGKVKLAGNYLYKLDNRKLKNEFNDLKFETINYSIKDLLIFCKNYF